MLDPARLGTALQKARHSAGMTQRRLADAAGLTVNYLSLLENGHRLVSLDTLVMLAGLLGTRVSTLVAEASNEPQPATGMQRSPALSQAQSARPAKPRKRGPSQSPKPRLPATSRPTSPNFNNWIPGF